MFVHHNSESADSKGIDFANCIKEKWEKNQASAESKKEMSAYTLKQLMAAYQEGAFTKEELDQCDTNNKLDQLACYLFKNNYGIQMKKEGLINLDQFFSLAPLRANSHEYNVMILEMGARFLPLLTEHGLFLLRTGIVTVEEAFKDNRVDTFKTNKFWVYKNFVSECCRNDIPSLRLDEKNAEGIVCAIDEDIITGHQLRKLNYKQIQEIGVLFANKYRRQAIKEGFISIDTFLNYFNKNADRIHIFYVIQNEQSLQALREEYFLMPVLIKANLDPQLIDQLCKLFNQCRILESLQKNEISVFGFLQKDPYTRARLIRSQHKTEFKPLRLSEDKPETITTSDAKKYVGDRICELRPRKRTACRSTLDRPMQYVNAIEEGLISTKILDQCEDQFQRQDVMNLIIHPKGKEAIKEKLFDLNSYLACITDDYNNIIKITTHLLTDEGLKALRKKLFTLEAFCMLEEEECRILMQQIASRIVRDNIKNNSLEWLVRQICPRLYQAPKNSTLEQNTVLRNLGLLNKAASLGQGLTEPLTIFIFSFLVAGTPQEIRKWKNEFGFFKIQNRNDAKGADKTFKLDLSC